ncbi:21666_t:CDS:2 [Gigaspora margarita]|uniref:21666_t:CDS:1 n=1 Tax=Gigaspora margarita TaxID=4874 RepID=A0ABN7V2E2_GIGMA|nr:21666_t:CDS:2 [Gigaspora margarita]
MARAHYIEIIRKIYRYASKKKQIIELKRSKKRKTQEEPGTKRRKNISISHAR